MSYNTALYIPGTTRHLRVSSSVPDSFQGFRYYKLLKGEKMKWPETSRFHLLYVLRGSACLCTIRDEKMLYADEGILIGDPEHISLKAIHGCRILMISLDEFPEIAEKQFLYSLPVHGRRDSLPAAIPVIPVLRGYLDFLISYLKDGFLREELAEVKYQELFLLLRFYYSGSELGTLFSSLICQTKEFRQIILRHASRATTAAALQEATGMKRTTFEKKFRKEFGTSAHQWLLRQKGFEVRKALSDPHIPLEKVRKRYGFNSATHFVRFCQNQFGCPPSILRKRLLEISL